MKKGFSLKKYNTFQIDAYCHEIYFIHEVKDLIAFYGSKKSEFLILGGGSNVLLLDDINRIILKNEIKGKEILHEDDEHVTVRVGGGENWHEFVQWSLTQGYSGIENLSLIPGSVGAAPVQNIGAYGVELEEVFVRLEGIQMEEGKLLSLNKIACQFSYRDSIFKHSLKDNFFITYVHFKLNKKFIPRVEYGTIKELLSERAMSTPTAEQVSDLVCEIRESKLPNPNVLGNAGSFFKNTI
ncbi:MAG: UDP-N-acetylmuramate dehydrogenase, partial [Saprospiraceae bacterium]